MFVYIGAYSDHLRWIRPKSRERNSREIPDFQPFWPRWPVVFGFAQRDRNSDRARDINRGTVMLRES